MLDALNSPRTPPIDGGVTVAILVLATLWLLVIAGVVVLCHAAKQGDREFAASHRGRHVAGDVVPLVVARRRVERVRSVAGSPR